MPGDDSRLLDRMRFDLLLPSSQRNPLAIANPQIEGDGHLTQQISRDDQALIDHLAVLAQPGRDVHRVAEIGELAFGTAGFADNHWTGMQTSAEVWDDVELTVIIGRKASHLAFDRKKAR